MLRRWVQKVVNDASREVDAARVKAANQLHEFAAAVKALATDESLSHEDLRKELCVLAGHVLHPSAPNRRSQIRQCLILKRHYARNMLMRIVQLSFGKRHIRCSMQSSCSEVSIGVMPICCPTA
jgi:hypothetical protein